MTGAFPEPPDTGPPPSQTTDDLPAGPTGEEAVSQTTPSLGAGWRPTPMWYMAEIIVVVVGVIIALGANAWWEGRRTDAVEAEVLEAVRREMTVNRTQLDTILALTAQCLERTDRFLRSAPASLREVPEDSAFYWAGSLACRRTFEPATDAAQTLVTAPGFDSALDLRIRRAVARWVTAVADSEEERVTMYAHGDATYQILAGYVAAAPEGGLDEFPTIPRLVARGGSDLVAELRTDTALIREILLRAHYQRAYGMELEEARAAADSALALLETVVGE